MKPFGLNLTDLLTAFSAEETGTGSDIANQVGGIATAVSVAIRKYEAWLWTFQDYMLISKVEFQMMFRVATAPAAATHARLVGKVTLNDLSPTIRGVGVRTNEGAYNSSYGTVQNPVKNTLLYCHERRQIDVTTTAISPPVRMTQNYILTPFVIGPGQSLLTEAWIGTLASMAGTATYSFFIAGIIFDSQEEFFEYQTNELITAYGPKTNPSK